mmetsp:Transcript_18143/g.17839  ORF Transcript_18143/g.17839 Transcript_18143/m.17839 type:complete len:161 (-) Transcript_18143:255-737(-)
MLKGVGVRTQKPEFRIHSTKEKTREAIIPPYKSRNYRNIEPKYQLSAGALRTFEHLKSRNLRSTSSQEQKINIQLGAYNNENSLFTNNNITINMHNRGGHSTESLNLEERPYISKLNASSYLNGQLADEQIYTRITQVVTSKRFSKSPKRRLLLKGFDRK